MRRLFRFGPVALLFAVTAALVPAADPPPLVKPVAPGGGFSRIRLPMLGKQACAEFKAQIPKPKKKGGGTPEVTDIVLSIGVGPSSGSTSVSMQQWKAWGFEVPESRVALLPELIIPGWQVSPKPMKGRDIEYRLRDIKVNLYEAPGGDKAGISNHLGISVSMLTNNSDAVLEPRVHFADRYIELSAPNGSIKKLNTGEMTSPAPQLTTDEKLVASFIPMNNNAFTFMTVNGHAQYIRIEKLYTVSAILTNGSGIKISMPVNMARGCGVEMDERETTGKVRELRFGPVSGPNVKGQKDFVLRDITIPINKNEEAYTLWVSAQFVEEYFKDGVFGCASDGVWRLHGRVKPDLLEDIKTRKPVIPMPKKQ